jgi:hypothetical protein
MQLGHSKSVQRITSGCLSSNVFKRSDVTQRWNANSGASRGLPIRDFLLALGSARETQWKLPRRRCQMGCRWANLFGLHWPLTVICASSRKTVSPPWGLFDDIRASVSGNLCSVLLMFYFRCYKLWTSVGVTALHCLSVCPFLCLSQRQTRSNYNLY